MKLVIVASVALFAASAGTLFVSTSVDVADAPKRLDATDLDGDGDIDLFVLADAEGEAASLQVLLNDHGEFTPGWSATQSTSSSSAAPFDLDLADTDNDGDADVVYLVPIGTARQRFNDGTGAFSAPSPIPQYAGRSTQEPADMDGSGDVDLVYYEEDVIGYLGTMNGNGAGQFQFDFSTETWFGLTSHDFARQIELGDLTGDGVLDAAMASKVGLGFFESSSIGTSVSGLPVWQNQVELYTEQGCADVALADLDGNSRLDVVATVPFLNQIVVFLHATGGFSVPRFYAAGGAPSAITTADLDLDGNVDVIVTNPNNRISVLLGTGSGGFLAPQDFRAGRGPVDVVAADFDDDGDPDLAVACQQGGRVTVLLNTSAPPQPVIEGYR